MHNKTPSVRNALPHEHTRRIFIHQGYRIQLESHRYVPRLLPSNPHSARMIFPGIPLQIAVWQGCPLKQPQSRCKSALCTARPPREITPGVNTAPLLRSAYSIYSSPVSDIVLFRVFVWYLMQGVSRRAILNLFFSGKSRYSQGCALHNKSRWAKGGCASPVSFPRQVLKVGCEWKSMVGLLLACHAHFYPPPFHLSPFSSTPLPTHLAADPCRNRGSTFPFSCQDWTW